MGVSLGVGKRVLKAVAMVMSRRVEGGWKVGGKARKLHGVNLGGVG